MTRRLDFRILGPLEVRADDELLSLGGPRQRALLALLLLNANRVVARDRLIDELGGGRAGEAADHTLSVQVSRLRKALDPRGHGDPRLVTRPPGYLLQVEPGELDLHRFEELCAEGRQALEHGDARLAAAKLREAESLWHGRPLADLELEPFARVDVERLEELRLAAVEDRIEAELALGHHSAVVPELDALVAEHPLRERLRGQLMLALYRSGRQADALNSYRAGRSLLVEELALEPNSQLKELEQAILRQDARLEPPERTRTAVALAPQRRGSGSTRDAVENSEFGPGAGRTPLPGPSQGAPYRPAPPQQEQRRARPQSRSSKLITAGAAIIVAVAAVAAGVILTHGGSGSLESLPPGVAIISAADGSLVSHISTAEIPEPSEVVTGNGHFWVWGLHPFQLVEIDSHDGRIVRHVGSPFSGDATWFLPDGRNVWFTDKKELVRVDAAEGIAVDRYHLIAATTNYGLAWVTRCSGSLWVADNPDSRVLRVDPTTGGVLARIPAQHPYAIACGDGGLWVTWYDKGLHRIDPRTNRIVATASTPAPYVNEVAVGGGFAWVSNETEGNVYKVDRDGKVEAVYETGDGAHQMSFGGGRLWVANQDVGTVTGIDAATGSRKTYVFGHPVQSVAAQGSRLLVELTKGITFEDRIAALRGKVAKLIVPTYVFDPVDPALAWNPVVFMAEHATCAGLVLQQPGAHGRVVPDLATAMPKVRGGRTFTFTVRSGRRFAPPSGAAVTAEDVRSSIERALSPKLGSTIPRAPQPGMLFLRDVEGVNAFHSGRAPHVAGITVNGRTISFTLTRPSKTFLARLALPFFCTVPGDTPRVHGGLPDPPPSAGPYYMSDGLNGEYHILKRNPNYTGPHPAKLDAIAFREGISPEHAVARVRSGGWDAALLQNALLAPGGDVVRAAVADPRLRTEELPAGGVRIAFPRSHGPVLHALLSSRLGCDNVAGTIDLASLCLRAR
jgi:DNA-binding SARP family transcriptional activator